MIHVSVCYDVVKMSVLFNEIFELCFNDLDRGEKLSKFMVQANQRSIWLTTIFIKYFVGGVVIGIIAMGFISLTISFIGHGSIEIEHLFVPIKVV